MPSLLSSLISSFRYSALPVFSIVRPLASRAMATTAMRDPATFANTTDALVRRTRIEWQVVLAVVAIPLLSILAYLSLPLPFTSLTPTPSASSSPLYPSYTVPPPLPHPTVSPATSSIPSLDPASFTNSSEVVIRRSRIEWKVQMAEKQLIGLVEHEIEAVGDAARTIVLDARELQISKVEWEGKEVTFKYNKVSEALGDKLTINLEQSVGKGTKGSLLIHYRTSPSARALQFLTADQTTDKKAPYLFSQCQAIHARSIVPCQDTPSVKAPYTAKVTVPAGLTCLMSAISTGKETTDPNNWTFSFAQVIPIPSYLIAIVVGVLDSREIGPRSAVWAEPSVVQAAADEFTETEEFLKTAEEIAGPYVWKRYDLVVLPATFPYGGMENPCLTFVTPTIIAGDKSLVSVVAHEIAHSWTGNLVTTASWDHFWLNEGFTVYLERRINERIYGTARRYFDAVEGFNEIAPTLKLLPPPQTRLRQDLGENDPDDAYTILPYEKGSALLLYIEQNVLTKEETENFLKEHVKAHASKSLDTETWLEYMMEKYPKMKEVEGLVKEWLYGEGMPPAQPKWLDESLIVACNATAKELTTNPSPTPASFLALSAPQKVFVLDLIKQNAPIEHAKLELFARPEWGIATSGNCEMLVNWISLGMSSKWKPAIQPALDFAKKNGRLKYAKRMYR